MMANHRRNVAERVMVPPWDLGILLVSNTKVKGTQRFPARARMEG
jgi:hypothetical protein